MSPVADVVCAPGPLGGLHGVDLARRVCGGPRSKVMICGLSGLVGRPVARSMSLVVHLVRAKW